MTRNYTYRRASPDFDLLYSMIIDEDFRAVKHALECLPADIRRGYMEILDFRGLSLLHDGVFDLTLLRLLLDGVPDANLDVVSGSHMTPLLLAAAAQNRPALHLLLERGANADVNDGYRDTVVSILSRGFCREQEIAAAIDAGCSVDTVNNENATPLLQACETGTTGAACLLFDRGATPYNVQLDARLVWSRPRLCSVSPMRLDVSQCCVHLNGKLVFVGVGDGGSFDKLLLWTADVKFGFEWMDNVVAPRPRRWSMNWELDRSCDSESSALSDSEVPALAAPARPLAVLAPKVRSFFSDTIDRPFMTALTREKLIVVEDDTLRYCGDSNGQGGEPFMLYGGWQMQAQNVSRNIAYFEVTILSGGSTGPLVIAVGIETSFPLYQQSEHIYSSLPGWKNTGVALHSDDSKFFCGGDFGTRVAPHIGVGSTIGVGLNFATHEVFFTVDGEFVYRHKLEHLVNFHAQFSRPAVGMRHVGESARVNMGQRPFVFDFRARCFAWTCVAEIRDIAADDIVPRSLTAMALDDGAVLATSLERLTRLFPPRANAVSIAPRTRLVAKAAHRGASDGEASFAAGDVLMNAEPIGTATGVFLTCDGLLAPLDCFALDEHAVADDEWTSIDCFAQWSADLLDDTRSFAPIFCEHDGVVYALVGLPNTSQHKWAGRMLMLEFRGGHWREVALSDNSKPPPAVVEDARMISLGSSGLIGAFGGRAATRLGESAKTVDVAMQEVVDIGRDARQGALFFDVVRGMWLDLGDLLPSTAHLQELTLAHTAALPRLCRVDDGVIVHGGWDSRRNTGHTILVCASRQIDDARAHTVTIDVCLLHRGGVHLNENDPTCLVRIDGKRIAAVSLDGGLTIGEMKPFGSSELLARARTDDEARAQLLRAQDVVIVTRTESGDETELRTLSFLLRRRLSVFARLIDEARQKRQRRRSKKSRKSRKSHQHDGPLRIHATDVPSWTLVWLLRYAEDDCLRLPLGSVARERVCVFLRTADLYAPEHTQRLKEMLVSTYMLTPSRFARDMSDCFALLDADADDDDDDAAAAADSSDAERGDVRLRLRDGRILLAHRVVLTLRCAFFGALDRHGALSSTVDVSDIDAELVVAAIRFAYTNEIDPALHVSAVDLAHVARRLGIDELAAECERHCVRRVEFANAQWLHDVAGSLALPELALACRAVLERGFPPPPPDDSSSEGYHSYFGY